MIIIDKADIDILVKDYESRIKEIEKNYMQGNVFVSDNVNESQLIQIEQEYVILKKIVKTLKLA